MENMKELLESLPQVLASGSPRRLAILREFGADPAVIIPGCEEKTLTSQTPACIVMSLALRKGLWVKERISDSFLKKDFGSLLPFMRNERAFELFGKGSAPKDFLILSSDTAVYFEGRVLGKPKDESEAFDMLKAMSGKMNTVYSGVCVQRAVFPEKLLFYDKTDVYFKPYGDDDILEYIAKENVLDKAGAYGIQEGFDKYTEKIDGNLDTVIGFPLSKLLSI